MQRAESDKAKEVIGDQRALDDLKKLLKEPESEDNLKEKKKRTKKNKKRTANL